jgi:hypothetical protein
VWLSLITALAGFFGALVGALAAVIGPWWLRRSDRTATVEADRAEARRVAVVNWVEAVLNLSMQLDDEGIERKVKANRAVAELTSRLLPAEKRVDEWIHGLGAYAKSSVDQSIRFSAFSMAGMVLIAWQRGDLDQSKLKPFTIVWDSERMEHAAAIREDWPDRSTLRMAWAK